MCRTYRIIPWHHRSLCCKQRSPLWGEQGTEWQREVLRECRGAVFVKATGFAVCACDSNTDTRRIDGCLLQLFSWRGKWHGTYDGPPHHVAEARAATAATCTRGAKGLVAQWRRIWSR